MKRISCLVLLASFCLVNVSIRSSTFDDTKSLTAAEIIDKHLAAVGGKDALAKIQSRIAIGTVKKENDTGIKMAIMSEAPNRVTAVYVFERYDWQLTYDGSKAFVRPLFPRALTSVQDKYEEMLSSGLMFNSISLYNLLTAGEVSGAKFEAKGTKKVKDRLAYVVEMKRPQGGTARLFFDAETFMWVRTEFGKVGFSKPLKEFTNNSVPHGEDEVSIDFYFETSDFRDVNGIKLPFKYEQSISYPQLHTKMSGSITGTITEYRQNESINPKMFQ